MERLEDRILADIRQTGFLTELEVGRILIKKGFRVESGRAYEDLDESKSREIDIVANTHIFAKDVGFRFFPHLIIEIKKDLEKPWVIFLTKEDFPAYGWS